MTGCTTELVTLVLLSLALLISLFVNVIVCFRRRTILCKDTDEGCNPHVNEGESPSQDEGHYFHNLGYQEQLENPHNHQEQQENPIYGNISTERQVSIEVCYEMMTIQRTRDRMKPLDPDLNYASLDLKVANKHKKKHRHQQGHSQGQNRQQDNLPARLTPPANTFLEVEADMDVQLPARDTSTMVSHSSIYLNSQQIAQEAEGIERERGINMARENVNWEGMRQQEDGGSREWKGEQDSDERKDYSNGRVCAQLSEVEAIQSGADHFTSSLSHESVQQD